MSLWDCGIAVVCGFWPEKKLPGFTGKQQLEANEKRKERRRKESIYHPCASNGQLNSKVVLLRLYSDTWHLKEHTLCQTHTRRGHMSCGPLLFKHCIPDRRHNSQGRLSGVYLKQCFWKASHYGCQSRSFPPSPPTQCLSSNSVSFHTLILIV